MVCNLKITPTFKKELCRTLKMVQKLFGGGLRKVDCELININLKEGAKP